MTPAVVLLAALLPAEPVPRPRPPRAERLPCRPAVCVPCPPLPQFPAPAVVAAEIRRAERNRDRVAFLAGCGLIDRAHYAWAVEVEARLRLWRRLRDVRENQVGFDKELGDGWLGTYLSPEDFRAGRLPRLP